MIRRKRPLGLRCFLSSPRLVNTRPLRHVLDELNVEVGSVEDLPTAGELPVAMLLGEIRSASFVVGVLTREGAEAVLLELGLAIGLGKPVFLIAEDKGSLATSLLGFPQVIAPLADTEALRFHLEAFTASLAFPRKTVGENRPERFYGGGEAIPIRGVEALTAGVEKRVAEAFVRAGGRVAVSPRIGPGAEADMVVWLPEADVGAGGPLLVEIKANLKTRFSESEMRHIGRLLERSHLRAAVLVTGTAETGVAGRMLRSAYLYAISVSELERLANSDELLPALTRARNRLAHGVT